MDSKSTEISAGERGYRRGLGEQGQGQIALVERPQVCADAHGQEGMAAEREEIVVYPDPLDAQDLGPEPDQEVLGPGARGDAGPGRRRRIL